MKFDSQTSTTIEQSKHLLELGLKKETADMSWFRRSTNANFECCTSSYKEWVEEILPIVDDYTLKDIIPAWSLDRLRKILIKALSPSLIDSLKFNLNELNYDLLIDVISDFKKLKEFNPKYLEEPK